MLSKRAQSLKPSPTLQLVARARELAQKGHDVISLSVGEPDWATFSAPSEAGIEAIRSGFSKYTPANGMPELREVIVRQLSQDHGLNYLPTEVTVGTGAKFVLFAAFQMLCDEGDEVIIPAPYWVSYPVMVDLAGGKSIVINTDAKCNFKLTPEKLEKAITPKTKAFILCSPSNPTGIAYTANELKALAEVFRKHPRIVIISDDIYNRLMLSDVKLAPHILEVAPDLKDRTIVINGVSKSYSMTGWRIGWAVGPVKIIKAIADYQSQSTSSACSISQKAAIAAILKCELDIARSRGMLRDRFAAAEKELSQIPGIKVFQPDGAFYIWFQVTELFGKKYKGKLIADSRDLAAIWLDEYFVAAVPGFEFGCEGYIRASFAIETPKMMEAVQRLKKLVNGLE